MKKLFFIMMAMMASFSVYAQEINTEKENEVALANYPTNVFWTGITIDYDRLTAPYEIVIGTPPGTILGISGPSNPNIQTWRVENGMLYITLYERDFDALIPGETGKIEIATTVAGYYVDVFVI